MTSLQSADLLTLLLVLPTATLLSSVAPLKVPVWLLECVLRSFPGGSRVGGGGGGAKRGDAGTQRREA